MIEFEDVNAELWMTRGTCRRTGAPDDWYPKSLPGPTQPAPEARAVIKICHECPVSSECLAFALGNRERYGVWGGTTPSDRRRMLEAST